MAASTTTATATSTVTHADTATFVATTTLKVTTVPARVLTLPEKAAITARRAEDMVEASMQEVIATGGFDNTTEASVETHLGTLTAFSMSELLSGPETGAMGVAAAGGSFVAVPLALAQDVPAGTALALLPWLGTPEAEADTALLAELASHGGAPLAAPIVGISLSGPDGRRLGTSSLREPILFKLPDPANRTFAGGLGSAKCAYLSISGNFSSASWSQQGVRRAAAAEVLAAGQDPEGIWCVTEHLSIFSAIGDAVLGCLNVELLSSEALSAIARNEDWWSTRPAQVICLVAAAMVACFAMGHIRDVWSLRLGREEKEGKRVDLCKRMVEWGPQVVKYRYTVFVVFLKDLILCAWRGRGKLETPTFVAFMMQCLVLRTGVALSCMSSVWAGPGPNASETSLPHSVLCLKLELKTGVLESIVEDEFADRGPLAAVRRFWIIFFASHPLLDAMRAGVSSLSARKRVTLQAAGIFGAIAVNAMIFNFSGQVRGWESGAACPIDPASHFFVVIATLVSIAINIYPNAFLSHLGKQTYGRPLWNALFWLLSFLFLAISALLVTVSLANLYEGDEDTWHSGLRLVLCMKLLGMPTAKALQASFRLEWFLTGDSAQRAHLLRTFGRRCRQEGNMDEELSVERLELAEQLARRSISAASLVKLLALLSDRQPLYRRGEDLISPGDAGLLGQAFAEAILSEDVTQPTDRLVAYCRSSSSGSTWGRSLDNCSGRSRLRHDDFEHVIVSVLVDALGQETSYGVVQGHLARRDFDGLLDLLEDNGCHRTRYWIDLFALNFTSGLHAEGGKGTQLDKPHFLCGICWHEDFLAVFPTLVRCMDRDCAKAMAADLRAQRKPRCGQLRQLLVLDRDFLLIHEHFTLAELMLGAEMCLEQRMVLHPSHLKGTAVRRALRKMERYEFLRTAPTPNTDLNVEKGIAKEKEANGVEGLDLEDGGFENVSPSLMPYLGDKDLVISTVQDLVIEGIKLATAAKEDDNSIWQELNMADIVMIAGHLQVRGDEARGSAHDQDGGGTGTLDADDWGVD